MTFEPKSEKEIAAAGLLPDGEYDFEVTEASDEISKRSNAAMIKVKLGIYNGATIGRFVFDYLMPSMAAKLRHFCDSVGLLKEYEGGALSAEMCKGRSGRVKLVIEQDKAGQYPDKNAARDYLVRAAKPLAAEAKTDGKPDDLPF